MKLIDTEGYEYLNPEERSDRLYKISIPWSNACAHLYKVFAGGDMQEVIDVLAESCPDMIMDRETQEEYEKEGWITDYTTTSNGDYIDMVIMRDYIESISPDEYDYSVTYEVFSGDGLEAGETDERGFDVEDKKISVPDLLHLVESEGATYVEGLKWFEYEYKSGRAYYEKGEVTYYHIHVPDEKLFAFVANFIKNNYSVE